MKNSSFFANFVSFTQDCPLGYKTILLMEWLQKVTKWRMKLDHKNTNNYFLTLWVYPVNIFTKLDNIWKSFGDWQKPDSVFGQKGFVTKQIDEYLRPCKIFDRCASILMPYFWYLSYFKKGIKVFINWVEKLYQQYVFISNHFPCFTT